MLILVDSLKLFLPLAWLLTLEPFLILALSRNISFIMNFYGLLSNNKVRLKYKPDLEMGGGGGRVLKKPNKHNRSRSILQCKFLEELMSL